PDLWHHTANPLAAVLFEGHSAVALFMVLSGFIFTYGAYGKHVVYRAFIINRLLRIYPLYIAIILLGLSVYPSRFTLSALITTILPLANIQTLQAGTFLAMAWAVAVEFQFYLLYPFLVMYLNKSVVRTVIATLAVALLFRLLGLAFWANPRELGYWHLIGRMDQFILGMGSAVLLKQIAGRTQWLRILLILSIPIAIGTLFGFHRLGGWPSAAPWKIIWPTVEGLIWSLFIIGYVGTPRFLPRWLETPLAKVGELSFSLYLLHFPIIDAIHYRVGRLPQWTGNPSMDGLLLSLVIVVPITLACSLITYRAIELPFLNLRVPYLKPIEESPLFRKEHRSRAG
ncbi:MAG: acyltransferase, partial [Kiritimatiellae bacterium]|nr:acyltransferase [Kiritimatiellia bacterium]